MRDATIPAARLMEVAEIKKVAKTQRVPRFLSGPGAVRNCKQRRSVGRCRSPMTPATEQKPPLIAAQLPWRPLLHFATILTPTFHKSHIIALLRWVIPSIFLLKRRHHPVLSNLSRLRWVSQRRWIHPQLLKWKRQSPEFDRTKA